MVTIVTEYVITSVTHLLGSQSCPSPRSTSATKLPLLTLGGGKLCCWTLSSSLKLLSTAAPSISEQERQKERLTWKGSFEYLIQSKFFECESAYLDMKV